jgi:hypothetical protein
MLKIIPKILIILLMSKLVISYTAAEEQKKIL